jgi:serralysin
MVPIWRWLGAATMQEPPMSPRPSSTQDLVDYLASGYWLETGTVPHSFGTTAIGVSLTGLSEAGQLLARAALEAWTTVADLSFSEVVPTAQIGVDDAAQGAMCYVVHTSGGSILSAQVNIGQEWLDYYGSDVGGYAFRSFLHEIGHALGLGHAGPYNGSAAYSVDARFQNDSWQQSVMSYFSQDQNLLVEATYAIPVTPMMSDILAMQRLYGVPVGGPSAGDTTWGIGSSLGTYLDKVFQGPDAGLKDKAMTIFDESGIDTLCLSNDTQSQRVDLNGGAFSSVYGEVGNLGIVPGTVIENYLAGFGNDLVGGNAAANRMELGAGCDRAWGKAGDDDLRGGAGRDLLYGDEGRDRLDGGMGRDLLTGGVGRDAFVFNSGRDVIAAFQNNADTLVLDAALWGGRHLSARQLVDRFACVRGDDVLFDFGQGSVLRIKDVPNADNLVDDVLVLFR